MLGNNAKLARENTTLKARLSTKQADEERMLQRCTKAEYSSFLMHRNALQAIDASLQCIEATAEACRKARAAVEQHYAQLVATRASGVLRESNRQPGQVKQALNAATPRRENDYAGVDRIAEATLQTAVVSDALEDAAQDSRDTNASSLSADSTDARENKSARGKRRKPEKRSNSKAARTERMRTLRAFRNGR
ncbi:hypothetical protein PAPHI01_1670 [Pancytospora philotis]|nr:hypothetical protein PAPHI01_1670 [Pancytospora philotis]